MTPVRVPDVVRGDVPGLLPNTPTKSACRKCGGTNIRRTCSYCGDSTYDHECNDGCRDCGGSEMKIIDWSSPLAIYAALHWLADRGHACLWMLPVSHGGRIEAWDGLTAWKVSAILVARSVSRVAAGLGPIKALRAHSKLISTPDLLAAGRAVRVPQGIALPEVTRV